MAATGEDSAAQALKVMREALGQVWFEALDRQVSLPWVEVGCAVGVFPQSDGQVVSLGRMFAFTSEENQMVRPHPLACAEFLPDELLGPVVDKMVDVYGMVPSLLWFHATSLDDDLPKVALRRADAERREAQGREVALYRFSKSAPWLSPSLLSDAKTIYGWTVWAGGRPLDPEERGLDGLASPATTTEWRNYWEHTIAEDLEPDLLARCSPTQAVNLVMDDWLLVAQSYDHGINEQFVFCRPTRQEEDPQGASRPKGKFETAWVDVPTSNGHWAVVQLDTYMNYDDDDRPERPWGEMDTEMRHTALAEAFEGAVVFDTMLDFMEWASAATAVEDAPFEWRVALVATLVDLPLPEMVEVKARLSAGGGLAPYVARAHQAVAEGAKFPVFVHAVPGLAPPSWEPWHHTPEHEYHLYFRDEGWTAWYGPMRVAAKDLGHLHAYIRQHHINEPELMRLIEVTSRPIDTPTTGPPS